MRKIEDKRLMLREKQGITLIALVVTIVIILILAGISMSLVLNNNGVIKRTKDATLKTEIAEEKEEIERAIATVQMGKVNTDEGYTTKDVADEINRTQEGKVSYYDNYIKYTKSGREYEIEEKDGPQYVDVEKTTDKTPGKFAGEGTSSNPYLIESIEDLVAMEERINSGEETYEGKHFRLERNLDFKSSNSYALQESLEPGGLRERLTTGEGFRAMGGDFKYTYNTETKEYNYMYLPTFKGNLDGNNKMLRNFYANRIIDYTITQSDDKTITTYTCINQGASLIGKNEGVIKNLTMENVNVNGSDSIAAVASGNFGEIYNVLVTGKVTAKINASGIVSANKGGVMKNCINRAEIITEEGGSKAGGIVASVSGEGGIVENCYNYGKVSLIDVEDKDTSMYYARVGGIAAFATDQSIIRRCCNYGEVIQKGYRSYTGGIAGHTANSTIEECCNLGKITASGGYCPRVGGITGTTYQPTIKNTYNAGDINIVAPARYTKVGGIVGEDRNNDAITLSNCYNIGKITAVGTGYIYKGDMEGQGGNNTTNITNCYYLLPGTGKLNGTGSPTVTGSEGKDETTMKSQEFLNILNTDSVWKMDTNNINKGYPILSWQ